MNNLARKTVVGFVQLILVLGVALFAAAWTFDFWQAWIYLFVFAASAALITAYLWENDPKLLERRVKAGPLAESDKKQKVIQLFAGLCFAGEIICPALAHRFSGSNVPFLGVLAGDALVAFGFLMIFRVFKANTFAAATIALAPGQKVISTGPYAVVRHPMYSGALVMLFGTPLAIGSLYGLLVFVPMAMIIVWRLLDEEKFLRQGLAGYQEYCLQVRYRLLPLIW